MPAHVITVDTAWNNTYSKQEDDQSWPFAQQSHTHATKSNYVPTRIFLSTYVPRILYNAYILQFIPFNRGEFLAPEHPPEGNWRFGFKYQVLAGSSSCRLFLAWPKPHLCRFNRRSCTTRQQQLPALLLASRRGKFQYQFGQLRLSL